MIKTVKDESFTERKNMNQLSIELKKIDAGAITPKHQTEGAAGADFFAFCPDGPIEMHPGDTAKVRTGVSMFLKTPDWALMLMPRSGLGSKGIILANTIGLIDSDYQGEISIYLYNRSDRLFIVNNGDRIAQGCFVPVAQAKFVEVDEFSSTTKRGDGGFGSTGGVLTLESA